MGSLKLVRTDGGLLDHNYAFIVWNSRTQTNIKLFDVGEWRNWEKFSAQARNFWDLHKDYDDDFDTDGPPEGSVAWIASELVPLMSTRPYFVQEAEKRQKRREKGPLSVAAVWVGERNRWGFI